MEMTVVPLMFQSQFDDLAVLYKPAFRATNQLANYHVTIVVNTVILR